MLDADHPELLLELPDDLDEHVLRREVELAELVHPLADPVRDIREPCRELVPRLADVTERIRSRMDRLGELDLASQDVLIEVVRALEQQLWMLRVQIA